MFLLDQPHSSPKGQGPNARSFWDPVRTAVPLYLETKFPVVTPCMEETCFTVD